MARLYPELPSPAQGPDWSANWFGPQAHPRAFDAEGSGSLSRVFRADTLGNGPGHVTSESQGWGDLCLVMMRA